MRRFIGFALGLVLILAIFMGCSPKTTPIPGTAPQPAPAQIVQPAAPAPTASPQQAAWDQVVSAAKKEGTVVAYTNEMVGDQGAAVAEAFKKSTGLVLERVAIGSAARAERIRSEARAGIYVADISDGSATFGAALKVDKLTQSLGDLLVFQEKGDVWVMDPRIPDPEVHIIYYNPVFQAVWVNTRLVKPEDEPKSWYDLLDQKWKGKKIGIAHPTSSSQAYRAYVLLTQKAGFKEDYFQKMGTQDPKFIPGTTADQMQAVARGETYLTFPGASSNGLPLVQQGVPIKPVTLKEGSFATGNSMTMVANAPHPNATKLFINWILGKEGQLAYNQARSTQPIRKDVADFTPPAGRAKYEPLLSEDSKTVQAIEAAFTAQVLTKMWIK